MGNAPNAPGGGGVPRIPQMAMPLPMGMMRAMMARRRANAQHPAPTVSTSPLEQSLPGCPLDALIATGGDDQKLSFLHAATGNRSSVSAVPFEVTLPANLFHLTQISDDLVVCSLYQHALALVNIAERKIVRALPGHTAVVKGISTMKGRREPLYFASASVDNTVRLWNAPSATLLTVLRGHSSAVYAVEAFEDHVYTGSYDNSVKMWDVRTSRCLRSFTSHAADVECLFFDPESGLLFSGADDQKVYILDGRTLENVGSLSCTAPVYSLGVRQNEGASMIFAGASSGLVEITDLRGALNGPTQNLCRFAAHGSGSLWDLEIAEEWGMFYTASWGDKKTKGWSFRDLDSKISGAGPGRVIQSQFCWEYGSGRDMTGVIHIQPNFREARLGSNGIYGALSVDEGEKRVSWLLAQNMISVAEVFQCVTGRGSESSETDLEVLREFNVELPHLFLLLFGCAVKTNDDDDDDDDNGEDNQGSKLYDVFRALHQLHLYQYSYLICRRVNQISTPSLVCLVRTCLGQDDHQGDGGGGSERIPSDDEIHGSTEANVILNKDRDPFVESLLRELRRRAVEVTKNPTFLRVLSRVGAVEYMFGSLPEWELTKNVAEFRDLQHSASFADLFEKRCCELYESRTSDGAGSKTILLTTHDGGEEWVHPEVLVWRSPFFFALFRSIVDEREDEGEVGGKRRPILLDSRISASDLRSLLQLYYTGDIMDLEDGSLVGFVRLLSHVEKHSETAPLKRLQKHIKSKIAGMSQQTLVSFLVECGWYLRQGLEKKTQSWFLGLLADRMKAGELLDDHLMSLVRFSSELHRASRPKLSEVETS